MITEKTGLDWAHPTTTGTSKTFDVLDIPKDIQVEGVCFVLPFHTTERRVSQSKLFLLKTALTSEEETMQGPQSAEPQHSPGRHLPFLFFHFEL